MDHLVTAFAISTDCLCNDQQDWYAWAARYNTRLLTKLTPKGVAFFPRIGMLRELPDATTMLNTRVDKGVTHHQGGCSGHC